MNVPPDKAYKILKTGVSSFFPSNDIPIAIPIGGAIIKATKKPIVVIFLSLFPCFKKVDPTEQATGIL